LKVVQLNVVYKVGSTGKIIDDISNTLIKNGHESFILYGVGTKSISKDKIKIAYKYELTFYRIISSLFGLQFNTSYFSTVRVINNIKKIEPDIVHLHVINGYIVNIYRLLKYLKKINVKTIITLHAEYMFTGSCGHAFDCDKWKKGCGKCPIRWEATHSYVFDRTRKAWKMMYDSLRNMNNVTFTSVSPWLYNRAIIAPITANKQHFVVLNGVNTDNFTYRKGNELISFHKLLGKKILLHVTANFSNDLNDLKGGHYIYEIAKRVQSYNMVIIVIGNNSNKDFLENMISIGKVYDSELLAKYYSIADITLITSKRETFSMPTIESLSCGTPVIGFKAGGPESIALKEYSEFVEYGNVDMLIKKILFWTNDDNKIDKNTISQKAHLAYSSEVMTKNYIKIYQNDEEPLNDK